MRLAAFLASLLLLAGCGGGDPTPDPEDAASAEAINASVDRAENEAIETQLNASPLPTTAEAEEALAENLIAGPARAPGPLPAPANTKPTPVDPAAGDPSPPVQ